MASKPKKILVVSGEASGNRHGASVVCELLAKDPTLKITHTKNLAVTGIFEVLLKLPTIIKAFKNLVAFVEREKPDLVILIDYPDFNLRLAKKLQPSQVPIVYYISPQVWAWRQNRVYRMKKWISKMLVVFPFEKEFYKAKGMDVQFVGHPMLDHTQPVVFHRNMTNRSIALLPGSRKNEVGTLLPPILKAAVQIHKKYPEFKFELPVASTLNVDEIKKQVEKYADFIEVKAGNFQEVISRADVVISCSGTATLETALQGRPMVICYKLNPISYLLGRLIIRGLSMFGMPNIILGEKVVPELLQGQVTGQNIARHVFRYLEDVVLWKETSEKLLQIRTQLGQAGASRRVAHEVLGMLKLQKSRAIIIQRVPAWVNALRNVFAPPLWACSVVYKGAVQFRNMLYDRGFRKKHHVKAKVISIGNITVGGTGKTPFAMALAVELQRLGKNVAILSRGYKRKSKNAWDCVSDGSQQNISVQQAGDEPSLMAGKLSNVPIYVGSNRYQVALEVLKRHAVDIFLLDDGFQHRKFHRDVDIVTLDATLFYGSERVLPFGQFREPISSLKRAHCFILTRVDQVNEEQKKAIYETLKKVSPNVPIVEACYRPKELRHLITKTILPLEKLKGKRVFAFAGIGNPRSFEKVIHRLKGDVVDFKAYLDHFAYREADVGRILDRSQKNNAQIILTTEKDAIRLPLQGLKNEPLYALSVDLELTSGQASLENILNRL